jgi:hypothetical protein
VAGVRIRIALVLALLATVPVEAARDRFVRDSPRSAVATCLRATGAPGVIGLLGPLESRMSPYDVLRVTSGGVSVAGTARLGVLDECPAVAADPTGHALVAATARERGFRGVIRAALAEPGGGFGAPIDIARTGRAQTTVAAAMSPRGDAVVAWTVVRYRGRRGLRGGRTRVIAALRPAGGTFGRPQFLTPWRRSSFGPMAKVSAGMDASGRATVAWAQPIPDRGNIPSLSTVQVAAAAPGERFGPAQVLTPRVQDTERLALSEGPDGRALLAHDGQGTIQVFERAPGASEFARVHRLRPRRGFSVWQEPDVALAPDGSALVAWSDGQEARSRDVFVASRRGTGAWTGPVALQQSREDDSSFVEFGVSLLSWAAARRPPTISTTPASEPPSPATAATWSAGGWNALSRSAIGGWRRAWPRGGPAAPRPASRPPAAPAARSTARSRWPWPAASCSWPTPTTSPRGSTSGSSSRGARDASTSPLRDRAA